jgi:hypothetical protein
MRKLITSWLTWLGFKVGRVAARVADKPAPQVKFPRGMQWTCVKCGALLGTAKEDVHYGSLALSRQWAIENPQGFFEFKHCGVMAVQDTNGYRQMHSPDGWVG